MRIGESLGNWLTSWLSLCWRRSLVRHFVFVVVSPVLFLHPPAVEHAQCRLELVSLFQKVCGLPKKLLARLVTVVFYFY